MYCCQASLYKYNRVLLNQYRNPNFISSHCIIDSIKRCKFVIKHTFEIYHYCKVSIVCIFTDLHKPLIITHWAHLLMCGMLMSNAYLLCTLNIFKLSLFMLGCSPMTSMVFTASSSQLSTKLILWRHHHG